MIIINGRKNAKDLIVVESPNKIKSIQSYLGDGYNVIATGGHLRELAKNQDTIQKLMI